ncbi:MAG: Plug and carboxypeptidase regulatory-like domain-containing protein [Gemmatimonadaceae bacterium]|nr:Plug and carboxypeptidase regulatory-like domain-containing protein [Gemmatimonadaceae bacterium]
MPGPVARARGIRRWSAAVFCAALIVGAAETSAQATTSELHGVVLSAAGDPLSDVAVSIAAGDLSTRTDADGRFSFGAAPWGQVRLRLRALGHAPLDTLMLLQSGLAYTVRLRLARFVPQLDTVRVEATLAYGKPARYRHTGKFDDFYERRAKKPGSYFTREDIERSGRSQVSELVSSVAGITLGYRLSPRGMEPHLRVARCTGTSGPRGSGYGWFAVYLDGQRLRADPLDVLGELKTSEIETIEVYRGVSQLPIEAVGDACAAVFITTRYTPGSVLDTNR